MWRTRQCLFGISVCLRNNKILNLIVQKQLPICQWIVVFSEWYLKSDCPVNEECGGADDRITRINRIPNANVVQRIRLTYLWLQSLMKTRQMTYFHSGQDWTLFT